MIDIPCTLRQHVMCASICDNRIFKPWHVPLDRFMVSPSEQEGLTKKLTVVKKSSAGAQYLTINFQSNK